MEEMSPPAKKKTPSDTIRNATVAEYIQAHTKPNGGFKSFVHSNLFAALLVWALSQAVFFIGFIVTFWVKTTQLTEWKGKTEEAIQKMNEHGTTHSQWTDEREDREIAKHEARLDKLEEITRHVEVLESEHRRLTRDVEDLRNGKK